jgi:hypothetical protein
VHGGCRAARLQLLEIDLSDESAVGPPLSCTGSLAVLTSGRADALLCWSELQLAAENGGWISFAPGVASAAHTGAICSQGSFQVPARFQLTHSSAPIVAWTAADADGCAALARQRIAPGGVGD